MIGLTLEKNRKILNKEYGLRFASVFFGLLIFLNFIFAIVLFVSYIELSAEKKIIDIQFKEISDSDFTKNRVEFEEISKSINKKMSRIADSQIYPSFFIDLLYGYSGSDVTINSISMNFDIVENEKTKKQEKIAKISISGISQTRARLSEFQQNLRSEKVFVDTEIPYSSFTRNENIPFTAQITSTDLNIFLKETKKQNE